VVSIVRNRMIIGYAYNEVITMILILLLRVGMSKKSLLVVVFVMTLMIEMMHLSQLH
jgi:hypothetical protein